MRRSNGMSPSLTFLVAVVGALAILKGCRALAAKPSPIKVAEPQQVETKATGFTIQHREPRSEYRFGWIVYSLGIVASAYFIIRRRHDLRTSP